MNPTLIETLAQTLVADRLRDAAQSTDSRRAATEGSIPASPLTLRAGRQADAQTVRLPRVVTRRPRRGPATGGQDCTSGSAPPARATAAEAGDPRHGARGRTVLSDGARRWKR
jgi:hypothetical protein